MITDPVWPNMPDGMFDVEDPYLLFKETAKYFYRIAERACIVLGCNSDPRFLMGLPRSMKFIRSVTLEYVKPSYQGRILNAYDVAYCFGKVPKVKESSMLLPGRCLAVEMEARLKWHPCPRKIYHMKFLMKYYAAGRKVVDPFAGAGTTLVVAKLLGIPAVGIEIKEEFIEGIIRRLEMIDEGGWMDFSGQGEVGSGQQGRIVPTQQMLSL